MFNFPIRPSDFATLSRFTLRLGSGVFLLMAPTALADYPWERSPDLRDGTPYGEEVEEEPTASKSRGVVTQIPTSLRTAARETVISEWRSCSGRFWSLANKVGTPSLPLPTISLSNRATSADKSHINIFNGTASLQDSLEKGHRSWLAANLIAQGNWGHFLATIPFSNRRRPCQTIAPPGGMLGPAIETPMVLTPRYRVRVYSRGFGYSTPAIAKQRKNWIQNTLEVLNHNKWNPDLIRNFENAALLMTQEPHALERQIDSSIDFILKEWRACGGRYKDFVDTKFNMAKVTFLFEAGPFVVTNSTLGDGAMAAGESGWDGTLRTLSYHQRREKNPDGTYWYKENDYAFITKWEFGNQVYQQFSYAAQTFEQEGGSYPPCQFFGH